MIAQIVASLIHIPLCVLFVTKWDMGVKGLGYATMVTYFCMLIFISTYAFSITAVRQSLSWPNKASFANWGEYLGIGLPSAVMLVAEGWAFNILGIFAGIIGINDQAAFTILHSFNSILFMIAVGV